MITRILAWGLMGCLAIACASRLELSAALAAWLGVVVLLCPAGALLLRRQPLGVATTSGQLGASLVEWGVEFTRGKLLPMTAISALVWCVLGATLIASWKSPGSSLLFLAWAVDLLGLFHLLGIIVSRRGPNQGGARSLFLPAGALAAMLVSSTALFAGIGTDSARAWALGLAGGPLLVGGMGYGVMLGIMLAGGRRAWR